MSAKESPKDRGRHAQILPASAKRPVALPGFQNSFMPTSPIASKRRAKGKGQDSMGKRKEEINIDQTRRLANNSLPSSVPSSPIWHQHDIQDTDMKMVNEIEHEDRFGFGNMGEIVDVEMDGSSVLKGLASEAMEVMEAPSWKDEVCVFIS
jgi:hypothetical protein